MNTQLWAEYKMAMLISNGGPPMLGEPIFASDFHASDLIPEGAVGMATLKPVAKKRVLEGHVYNLPIYKLFPVKYVEPEQLIGIEIECEGANLFKTPTKWWRAAKDPSLRPFEGHPPMEYVLRAPITRKECMPALDYLMSRLKRPVTRIYPAERCSTHIHINCQNYSMRDVITFYSTYVILEHLLVEWCGETRVGNMFCLRSSDAQNTIHALAKMCAEDNFKSIGDDQYRYMACNMASIPKFGSLEFRALRGVIDVSVILTWIDVLLSIRDFSRRHSDPRQIVHRFEASGPEEFLNQVLGEFTSIFQTRDWKDRMWDGSRLVRDVAFSTNWEKPKVTKPKRSVKEKSGGPK